jgi:AraC-like DNA-binding protein
MDTNKKDVIQPTVEQGVVNKLFSIEKISKSNTLFDVDTSNQIFAVTKGECVFSIKDDTYVLTEGDLFFCPSFSLYSFTIKDVGEVYRFKFSQRYMQDFLECYKDKTIPSLLNNKKENLQTISYLKTVYAHSLTEFQKITATNVVLSFIVSSYGTIDGNGVVETQISDIINYIYKNYDKDISLDTLAKEFCISKMVLSRKISKYVGVDLRVFVSDIRVRAYIKMRADKRYANLSALELAYKCGFKSYETFYRAYKRFNDLDKTY